MDIWELAFKKIAKYSGPSYSRKYPKVLRLNKELNGVHYESASAFINKYLKEYDLAHLYALNIACFDVIEISVELIDKAEEGSSLEFEDIVKENLNPFPEIQTLINNTVLSQELHEVAEGKHYSNKKLKTPVNMLALGQLSYELQKTIENGPWQMDEKAHAYMCSLTIGNYKHFDFESFVYQLSRNIDCEDNIDNFLPYLQEGAKGRPSIDMAQHWHEAEVLRLIQWAEIGNISESVKMFCENIVIRNPFIIRKPLITANNNNNNACEVFNFFSSFLRSPFALFRSDLALIYLNDKLKKYIDDCQEVLQDDFRHMKKYFHPDFCHLAKLFFSACYVFGAYRLGVDQFNINLINNSTAYLQAQQLSDASFLPSEYHHFFNCQLNAMVIHALWISEAFGWKRSTRRSLKHIKEKQDRYGVWYDNEFDKSGHMTGLILDSFELAKDNPVITFKIPDHKKKSEQTIPSVNLSKLHEIVNHIEIGTIQNIFGNTLQSGTPKPKKKKKANPKKDDEFDNKTEPVIWEDHKKALFLRTNNGKYLFKFADSEPIRLGFERLNHPPKLLGVFCGHTERNTEYIKKALETTDSASHRVSECNKLIGRELEKKGFLICPKGFRFIEQTNRRGIYRSNIPVFSMDKYEIMLHKNEEEYIDDSNFDRHEDDWD